MWSSCKREPQVALSLHPSLCGLARNLILDFTPVLVASNQKEAELFIHLFCKMHNDRLSPPFDYNMRLAHTSCSALCCSSLSLKWKSYDDAFCCLRLATCTWWGQSLLLLRTSRSWICRPMTTVCLGGWCRGPSEGGDVWHQMFVCDIFGIFLFPNTLGGGVFFKSFVCMPTAGWVST